VAFGAFLAAGEGGRWRRNGRLRPELLFQQIGRNGKYDHKRRNYSGYFPTCHSIHQFTENRDNRIRKVECGMWNTKRINI
jgi:hypothetical protein